MSLDKTEVQLRDEQVPWPKTSAELIAYIEELVSQQHDYGTCVYAMSMSAVAAFQYVAGELGCTRFQASCADLDIIRRTRSLKGPFMILNANNMVYPQYSLLDDLRKAMTEWEPWAAERARELLKTNNPGSVHPDVWAHWEALSAKHPETKEGSDAQATTDGGDTSVGDVSQ